MLGEKFFTFVDYFDICLFELEPPVRLEVA